MNIFFIIYELCEFVLLDNGVLSYDHSLKFRIDKVI